MLGTDHLTCREGLWFFVSFRIFFSDNTRVRIFIFFVVRSANFFPEFNIRLYDKNSESDYYFFPPSKSESFFQQHWESEYFFRNSRNSSIITLTNHRNLRQNQLPLYILFYKKQYFLLCKHYKMLFQITDKLLLIIIIMFC